MADEPEVQAEDKGTAAPKKPKPLLLIVLGVVLFLMGGAGFWAYTTIMAAKPAIEEQAPKPPEKKKAPDEVGQMLLLDTFVVNLADQRGKRYLKVRMEIELESQEGLDKATKAMPKLRDMVIMLLTSLSFEEVMTPEGKISVRDELLDRTNQILKPERARNVYFTEFIVQ